MAGTILALDQGTTNSKAVLISQSGAIIASGAAPVEIAHPRPGWVEQDGEQIWRSQCAAIAACLADAPHARIEAIGISNQRESVLAWDRATVRPLSPVISWQCRRTGPDCAALMRAGHGPAVLAKTGLPLDPMFPATKLAHIMRTYAAGRAPADIALGTIDAWLIAKLTAGAVHATDTANAARTQLLSLAACAWDADLLALFGIDRAALPQVRPSMGVFGLTSGVPGIVDGTPIASAIGDSHAALFAQGAFTPGDGKVTFGTGSSVMTTIDGVAPPPSGLTTTIAWSLDGAPTYAFEGNILVSASIFPWAAELLGLSGVDALLSLAETVPDSAGVSLVPAHVGLGAPHWSTDARGLISGLTFRAGPAHIARAAAESLALQVRDVLLAMGEGPATGTLFADGGPTRNPFLMQLVADILDRPIAIRDAAEASALGAGYLAGLATGFWPSLEAVRGLVPAATIIAPRAERAATNASIDHWKSSIARALMT